MQISVTNTKNNFYSLIEVKAGKRYMITWTSDRPFLIQFGEIKSHGLKPSSEFIEGIASTYRYWFEAERDITFGFRDLRILTDSNKTWNSFNFDIKELA